MVCLRNVHFSQKRWIQNRTQKVLPSFNHLLMIHCFLLAIEKCLLQFTLILFVVVTFSVSHKPLLRLIFMLFYCLISFFVMHLFSFPIHVPFFFSILETSACIYTGFQIFPIFLSCGVYNELMLADYKINVFVGWICFLMYNF